MAKATSRARPTRAGRRPADAAAGPPPSTCRPSRYIVKVDRATGEALSDPIDPAELLVHAHRDNHPVEIAAQFLASRLVQVTGNESLVKEGLGRSRPLGAASGGGRRALTGTREVERRIEAAPRA